MSGTAAGKCCREAEDQVESRFDHRNGISAVEDTHHHNVNRLVELPQLSVAIKAGALISNEIENEDNTWGG
jgi:hypothetical protein